MTIDLTDDHPCLSCPALKRVSAVKGSPRVRVHCADEACRAKGASK